MAVLLTAGNFAASDASCADISVLYAAGGCDDSDFLDIGRPASSGLAVAVAYIVTTHLAFSADCAYPRHLYNPPNS